MTERKEGWWMPAQSRKFHYFVEGRALCHGWIFPNYDDISPDTGNEKKGPDDCAACFKKLVKLRASRASDSMRTCPKCSGSGWVEDVCNHLAVTKECELCDGVGKIPAESDNLRRNKP